MSSNPIIPMTADRLLMLAHSQVMSINRRALRPLQRTLEANPAINEQMSQSGGFEQIIDRQLFTPEAQASISRLCEIQNTILTSDRFGNQATAIPTVQEESDGIGKIINTVTGIKQHLDECCDEIKLLLRDLRQQIRDFEDSVKDLIKSSTHSIKLDITLAREDFLSFYNSELGKLEAFLPSLKGEIYNEIRNIVKDENRVLSDKIAGLERQLIEVNSNVTSAHSTITTVERTLAGYLFEWAEYRLTYGLDHDKLVAGITASTAEINGAITLSENLINTNTTKRTTIISKQIIDEIDKKVDTQTEFLKDVEKGFPSILTCEICANIVGESYIKWDSISQYYPTLVFVFNEVTTSNNPRRSQIKLRLNKLSAEITDQDINDVITRIKDKSTIRYWHGSVKGNYVSKDKRFKTTIFGKDKQSISKLLNSLFTIIPETFDTELLSITDIGRKRPSLTKRTSNLHNIELNLTNYDDVFNMQLKSVNLLVNGVNRIIKLT